jgi:hypothetical protein
VTGHQKGESPVGAGLIAEHGERTGADCAGIADRAVLLIEGEAYAEAYLQRLRSDLAQPGELAVVLAFLRGEMLHGACSVIEKVLRGAA